MDQQIRNFRDFLELYNKITEMCFKNCVDNFFNRGIAEEEGVCVDRCVQKFAKVNQRIMNVYVEVQSTINTRRLAELEAQANEAANIQTIAEPAIQSTAEIQETQNTLKVGDDGSR